MVKLHSVSLFLLIALAACALRPATVLMPDAVKVGHPVQVYYATTRNAEPAGVYGDKREYKPLHGMLTVTIPPGHAPGTLEVTSGTPDPAVDFAIAAETRLGSDTAFRSTLARALRRRPRGQREAVIFVHGFNVNFAEGAFRMAQLVNDFDITGVPVYFSWSSAASVVGYEHDRDSVLFARDALEQTILDARAAGAESVILMAHSMGALLAIETLRQMAIRNPALPRRAVNVVVLISPDIDVSVFHAQAWRIGKLPQPFVIFISNKDRALQLSALLSGTEDQLGNIRNIDRVAGLPVTVFNVTKFAQGSDFNHFTVGNSPALIHLFKNATRVRQFMLADTSGKTGLFPGTVLAVQRATEVLLAD